MVCLQREGFGELVEKFSTLVCALLFFLFQKSNGPLCHSREPERDN